MTSGREADREALRRIRTFPQLLKYLQEDLDWPVAANDFEEALFEYTPEELGLDANSTAKIRKIRRLRPLTSAQPWGIYFIEFEPKRLPVVALRRILGRVVLKKRASANRAERAAWTQDDLLFISSYGQEEARHIAFAQFTDADESGSLPVLRVLGWDNLDTSLHLDGVADVLRRQLKWPLDETKVDEWRSTWRSAFTLRHREVIATSEELAKHLAELATAIRRRILSVLSVETRNGPITRLWVAFRSALIHDLSADDFADMYAQTVAYGLLSARIATPRRDTSSGTLQLTDPFLKELLETFLSAGQRQTASANLVDFDELGLNDVVELLDHANMDAVLADFGDRHRQEDPVIHFYEDFLREYDPLKRMKRGVFYTPMPVVSFIVRSMDELLRTRFQLPDGLADTATWGELARRLDLKIPAGVSEDMPFVQILDLATGTGTFLVEVIDVIYTTLRSRWVSEGLSDERIGQRWNEYVPTGLLPRLYGYELLMAPYAIAHVKVGLKLYETGYRFADSDRARIYLTNSLEPAEDLTGRLTDTLPALAHEAQAVNSVKHDLRFTVVVGNPPYSVSSANSGGWIMGLVEAYKEGVRTQESQIQSLSNDYIKFLRFGEWLIERAGVGVLGLITGSGYLVGTQPRDLRRHLAETFDRLNCLDLHGSLRRSSTSDPTDEPVFEIMTGVAILVAARWNGMEPTQTFQASLTGPVVKKCEYLLDNSASSIEATVSGHLPSPPNYYFARSDAAEDVVTEYESLADLTTIFGTGDRQADKEKRWATGFTSQQDELAIAFSVDELEAKMERLATSTSFEDLRRSFRLCTTNQWNYRRAVEFARSGEWRSFVSEVTYRPFDRRWTVMNRNVLTIPRERVMSQLGPDSLGLVSSRAVNDLLFAHVFVVDGPVDRTFLSSKTSTNAYVFPLYVSPGGFGEGIKTLNLSEAFFETVARRWGVGVGPDSLPDGLDATEWFCYIYAVLHSGAYRNRFGELLKIDFPRLPVPANATFCRLLAGLGSQLIDLHLLRSPAVAVPITSVVGKGEFRVGRVSYVDETVWLDPARSKGFAGIPLRVWEYRVGGYQVCEKWLKDRKEAGSGRVLGKADLAHYQRIVVALHETTRVVDAIDLAIDDAGGWMAAFPPPT